MGSAKVVCRDRISRGPHRFLDGLLQIQGVIVPWPEQDGFQQRLDGPVDVAEDDVVLVLFGHFAVRCIRGHAVAPSVFDNRNCSSFGHLRQPWRGFTIAPFRPMRPLKVGTILDTDGEPTRGVVGRLIPAMIQQSIAGGAVSSDDPHRFVDITLADKTTPPTTPTPALRPRGERDRVHVY
ncbi:hypothetical protein KKG45_11360 [bacterium]|nr:hypothetical protein [bacterium]